jgi:hypothetical protein
VHRRQNERQTELTAGRNIRATAACQTSVLLLLKDSASSDVFGKNEQQPMKGKITLSLPAKSARLRYTSPLRHTSIACCLRNLSSSGNHRGWMKSHRPLSGARARRRNARATVSHRLRRSALPSSFARWRRLRAHRVEYVNVRCRRPAAAAAAAAVVM